MNAHKHYRFLFCFFVMLPFTTSAHEGQDERIEYWKEYYHPKLEVVRQDIPNVKIINVDDLKDAVNLNYKKRKTQILQAEKFIEDFLSEFDDWTNSRQLRPSILSIKKQIKNIIVDETIENVNSSSNGSNLSILDSDGFNERLNKVYEKFSDNLIRKIKEASKNGKDEKAIGIINQIFLDD